jgi:hypothetical protein
MLGRGRGHPAVTKNRRYEDHYDALNDARRSAASPTPCTLPQQAYGPEPLEWARSSKPPVWAWLTWPDRPASRVEAFAVGWNDRVVIVEWDGEGGMRRTVVWRNAVTRRSATTPATGA